MSVREQHTGVDIANILAHLSETVYPKAKKIVLVCDNLSTHKVHFLYDRFPPEEARRLSERFEWHSPPNMAVGSTSPSALSVLSRQCLARRIADVDTLRGEVSAWEQERNGRPHTVKWQFRAENARIKLKRLYPLQSGKTSCN